MKEKKTETFVYEGLGFPIKLIDCPMKKIFGEWVLDINIQQLQRDLLRELIFKPVPLTGHELRFMRKYLGLTTTDFGKILGVTHVSILKWEKETAPLHPATEIYIRLYVLEQLEGKDKEFRKLYRQVRINDLIKFKHEKQIPLEIKLGEDCPIAI